MIMHAWMSGAFAFSCLAAAGQLQLAAAQLLSGSVQLLRRSSVHATADSCSSFIGGTSMSWVFVASCCCAQVCLWWMTKQVLLLFDQLSNGQTSGGSGQHAGGFRSLQEGDASGRLHPKQDAVATHIRSESPLTNTPGFRSRFGVIRFQWWRLWLGLILENMILPWCILYTQMCSHIVWSGITYHKRHGKVCRIAHSH